MKAGKFLFLLFFPSICLASGNPSVLYWLAILFFVYVSAAIYLFKKALSNKADRILFLAFLITSLPCWYTYLYSTTNNLLLDGLLLFIVPVIFVIFSVFRVAKAKKAKSNIG